MSKADRSGAPAEIGGVTVAPGRSAKFEIPVARLPTGTWVSMPVAVFNGRSAGPKMWLSAAIHGDEINGVEIIRRVLAGVDARRLRGTIVAVPIVNLFGFVNESRYLPDRRDLNRSFPGSPRGSLAARMAHLFMEAVVDTCDVGIDLHTATGHRKNLPQIRADLDDVHTRLLADAFGAPVMMHAKARDGSLREAATSRGITVLLFEGGEAHRFDGQAIHIATVGVQRVMHELGMVAEGPPRTAAPLISRSSRWIRARRSGIMHLDVDLGVRVDKGQLLGEVTDAFGDHPSRIRSPMDGVVIGVSKNPLVSQGDALVHIAQLGE